MGVQRKLPHTSATGNQAPEEQLQAAVALLSRGLELSASAGGANQPLGSVLVFRPWPGRSLIVVGESPLAGEFRRLIASGAVPGWDLHLVPPGRTRLEVLARPLLHRTNSRRFYNVLERHGFTYVDEVTSIPDECLLELRNTGPRLVAAVRAAISELRPQDQMASRSDADPAYGRGRVPTGIPAALSPDVTAAVSLITTWGIAEGGARTLGDLLTLAPAAEGIPPDVARAWDRLAQLSLRPLAGPAELEDHVARLAEELLAEVDERCRLILTSRVFGPGRRSYDSLARELGISRGRVRQLEQSALIQLTRASRDHRYAPLRWRATSMAQHSDAVARHPDSPPEMAKLMLWLASKIG